jgi:SAM-dependent methyltransferase
MELQLRGTRLDGLTLDLGSGKSSYFGMMEHGADAHLLRVDACLEARPDLVADLEDPIPLASAAVDSVMLLNVLEHLYSYEQALCEISRVLRPGGLLVMFVPFLFAVHTARRRDFFTDDYFRYTGSALHRLLTGKANFTGPVHIQVCASGPFTAAASLIVPELRWGILKAVVSGCAFLLDDLLHHWRQGRKGVSHSEWPVGYYVEAFR